jgi:hypothetical protein
MPEEITAREVYPYSGRIIEWWTGNQEQLVAGVDA